MNKESLGKNVIISIFILASLSLALIPSQQDSLPSLLLGSESFPMNDQVNITTSRLFSPSESFPMNDQVNITASRLLSLTDSLPMNDQVSNATTRLLSLTESLSMNDQISNTTSRLLSLTESLTTTDKVSITRSNSETSSSGILIPLYSYPTDSGWNTVIQAKKSHPSVKIIVIINPSNGPGTSRDSNFVTGINKLQSAGVIVLGYVATNYGATNMTLAKSNIDKYKIWYNVNGINFDEMRSTAGKEAYYFALTSYVHSQGMQIAVGNPGADTRPSYGSTVDILTIYESRGLPLATKLGGGWHANYPKTKFSMVAYGVNSINQLYVNSASNYVGYLYMTDDNLPNPYNKVSSYLMTLASYLDTCVPPSFGDWTVVSNCTVSGHITVIGDVIVNSGGRIIVPNGASLNMDFNQHHLLVKTGGGVLIKAGGTIK